MIHGDAQLPRVSVITTAFRRGARLKQRVEPHADERRQLRARSPSASSRSPGTRPAWPRAPALRAGRRPCAPGPRSARAPAPLRRPQPPSPRPSAPRRSRRAGPAARTSVGSSSSAFCALAERRVQVTLAPLDVGELAVQERAVGRGGDRLVVQAARLVEPARFRRLARLGHIVLQASETQHLDAACAARQSPGRPRPPPRGSRAPSRAGPVRAAPLPSDERRHVRGDWRPARDRSASTRRRGPSARG